MRRLRLFGITVALAAFVLLGVTGSWYDVQTTSPFNGIYYHQVDIDSMGTITDAVRVRPGLELAFVYDANIDTTTNALYLWGGRRTDGTFYKLCTAAGAEADSIVLYADGGIVDLGGLGFNVFPMFKVSLGEGDTCKVSGGTTLGYFIVKEGG